jgi:single-stranded DNA-binding protein
MAQVSFRANIGKVRPLDFNKSDGKPRLSFSAAEGHRKKGPDGQWADSGTTWFNVTVFGRLAEDLADVLQEGAKQSVVVTGRQETRAYEHNGKAGESLDVVATEVGIVHKAAQGQQSGGFGGQQSQQWGGQSDTWGGQPSNDGFNLPNQSSAPF